MPCSTDQLRILPNTQARTVAPAGVPDRTAPAGRLTSTRTLLAGGAPFWLRQQQRAGHLALAVQARRCRVLTNGPGLTEQAGVVRRLLDHAAKVGRDHGREDAVAGCRDWRRPACRRCRAAENASTRYRSALPIRSAMPALASRHRRLPETRRTATGGGGRPGTESACRAPPRCRPPDDSKSSDDSCGRRLHRRDPSFIRIENRTGSGPKLKSKPPARTTSRNDPDGLELLHELVHVFGIAPEDLALFDLLLAPRPVVVLHHALIGLLQAGGRRLPPAQVDRQPDAGER